MAETNLTASKAFRKIGIGFLIAAATGGVTYLLGALNEIDISSSTPVWIAFAGGMLNALRVLLVALGARYVGNGSRTPPTP